MGGWRKHARRCCRCAPRSAVPPRLEEVVMASPMSMQTPANHDPAGDHREPDGLDILDVLIVGAGLSGIGAAYHLQTRCPDQSYAILEARGAIGGTWDL